MSDRLACAVAELVAALREEVATEATPRPSSVPVELIAPAEFARRASLGRSSVYLALASGVIRSVRVGSRRLIAVSELARLADSAIPAQPTEKGRARRDSARPSTGGRDAARPVST
jgi:hypothetical protein